MDRIKEFKVLDKEWESLSDHRNLVYEILPHGIRSNRGGRYNKESPRLIMSKFNQDKFRAVLDTEIWCLGIPETTQANERAAILTKMATDACDAAAPRAKGKTDHFNRYWWNMEIADLRKRCTKARRKLMRLRENRRETNAQIEEVRIEYRQVRSRMRRMIRTAKIRAWQDMVKELNRDPWGRPYRMVLNQMGRNKAPATKNITWKELQRTITELFPGTKKEHDSGQLLQDEIAWDATLAVKRRR